MTPYQFGLQRGRDTGRETPTIDDLYGMQVSCEGSSSKSIADLTSGMRQGARDARSDKALRGVK